LLANGAADAGAVYAAHLKIIIIIKNYVNDINNRTKNQKKHQQNIIIIHISIFFFFVIKPPQILN